MNHVNPFTWMMRAAMVHMVVWWIAWKHFPVNFLTIKIVLDFDIFFKIIIFPPNIPITIHLDILLLIVFSFIFFSVVIQIKFSLLLYYLYFSKKGFVIFIFVKLLKALQQMHWCIINTLQLNNISKHAGHSLLL